MAEPEPRQQGQPVCPLSLIHIFCHNGNLTNALELRRQLENEGAIFHGSSDTEVICYLITRNRLRMGSIETAISKTMDVLEGAYSLVIMSATKLIARCV